MFTGTIIDDLLGVVKRAERHQVRVELHYRGQTVECAVCPDHLAALEWVYVKKAEWLEHSPKLTPTFVFFD